MNSLESNYLSRLRRLAYNFQHIDDDIQKELN
jgi:hypothetical protein